MIKRGLFSALLALFACAGVAQEAKVLGAWELVWSDEFDQDGAPDSTYWSYERGFVRNSEPQWYQPQNAVCKGGKLLLEARQEVAINPRYDSTSSDWRLNRPQAPYTSASIRTKGKFEFQYGRVEVRAKIPTCNGAWPAIWTLGSKMSWPHCGEIDILEFYKKRDVQSIWANVAWGGTEAEQDVWSTVTTPYTHFTDRDAQWAEKYHIWRMDWDQEAIRLYLDDELLNETLLSKTNNGAYAAGTNPFHQPHFLLLNLALKDTQWDTPRNEPFPIGYWVDYVRVYQRPK